MSGSPPIAASIGLDANERLAQDLACLQCGYNLRGLDVHGPCPECGSPIRSSCRADLLRFASRRWLRRLGRGMALLAACAGLKLVLWTSFVTWYLQYVARGVPIVPIQYGIVQTTADLLILFLTFAGGWLVTGNEPLPSARSSRRRLRLMIRICLVAALVVGYVYAWAYHAGIVPWLWKMPVAMSERVISIMAFVCICMWLSLLGRRAGDDRLAVYTWLVMWVAALLAALMLARGALTCWTDYLATARGLGAARAFYRQVRPVFPVIWWVHAVGHVGLQTALIWLFLRYRRRFRQASAPGHPTWVSHTVGSPACKPPVAADPHRMDRGGARP